MNSVRLRIPSSGWLNRTIAPLVLSFVLLGAHPSAAQDTLSFFKNYFVTGDYAVGGASLWRKGVNGKATAQIVVSGVPDGADIVSAYLYVQTAETTQWSGINHASFNGFDFGTGASSIAKALNWDRATCPCWSVAWPGGRRLVTYRADVLRMLPLGADGKYSLRGPQTIQVPDSGPLFGDDDELAVENGSHDARAIGASLIVIYRNTDPTAALKSIVIYDGGVTKGAFSTWSLTLQGFYQASLTNPAARMTHVVGDGRPFLSEKVKIDGKTWTNPYVSAAGAKWDNPEFRPTLAPGASSTTVTVSPNGLLSDCVSFSAIVMSTVVQDQDGDGLLDIWESSSAPILDPKGQPLPNLHAMGADPAHKDLFIEIGFMQTETDTSYGGVVKHAHTHLPPSSALRLVGDAFAGAPVSNPDGSTGIKLHIDAGDAYPAGDADAYLIRGAGLARGGEAIDESVTVCARGATDPPWVCQFAGYPGTVGWKTSFRLLQNEVLSAPVPNSDDPCDVPGTTCRFDRNRKDMFRYALFAHFVGLPKSEDPASPDFHAPVTNTGIGDFPGGDLMVTLGGFDDAAGNPVGTPFMQASTLMHELGHNLERRHGGDAFEPNCKPTYLSAMNYLYQLRGLLDDGGTPHLDFARTTIDPAITETSLFDGSLGPLPYRIGWYAPLGSSYLAGRTTPAARHCDGSTLLSSDVPMVRIDARTAAGAIDWNGDGLLDASAFSQDVNFSGSTFRPALTPEVLRGTDDWSQIRLDQVGGRRNTGTLFLVNNTTGLLAVGPLSLDSGRGDLGRGDLGRGDLGRGDLGRGDLGRGDLGRGDLGRGDLGRGDLGRGDLGNPALGRGDLGRGDLGGGDLFVGDPTSPFGELSFEAASDLLKSPPNEFSASLIGADEPALLHGIRGTWTFPNIGGIDHYSMYRVPGAQLLPGAVWTKVGDVGSVPGQVAYSLTDTTGFANGLQFTYFAVAVYQDGVLSDPTNFVTITTVNDLPTASDQSVTTDEDTTRAIMLGGSDPEAQPLTFTVTSGPAHGTLTGIAPNLIYMPAANYNGPDVFTFKVNDGSQDSAAASVTITVNAVDDGPVATGESYSTAEDAALIVGAPGVLANDTDIDGPTLAAVLITAPLHGTLLLNGDGSFTYTPASNYSGPDSFTYLASDGTLSSNPATAAITVSAVNDAPIALDDNYSIAQNGTLSVSAPGVLANDSDIDSPTLTALLVSGPSHGTLTLKPNGSFTYCPASAFSGTDKFTYKVSDGSTVSNVSTVTIVVKPGSYTLINVRNLPPYAGVTFKPSANGTLVDFDWKFAVGGYAVASADALPSVTITGPGGYSKTFSPGAGCASTNDCTEFVYHTSDNTWDFDWKPKNAAVGTYNVIVRSGKTGQQFPGNDAYCIVFKK